MPLDCSQPHAGLINRFILVTALLTVVIGLAVLLGWAFDIIVLKSILPIWVSMKANTAACFILIGISLLLTTRFSNILNPQPLRLLSLFSRLCSSLAGLIGLLTLSEYSFGWNLGIDQWLFVEQFSAVGTSHPGRMAPETALSFVLLSVSLWRTSGLRMTLCAVLVPVSSGLLVTNFALVAVLSHAIPNLGDFGWFGLTTMAMHTAGLFVLLGLSIIAISWQSDVLSWSFGKRTTTVIFCGMLLLMFIGLNTNRSQFWMKETNRQIAYSEEVLRAVADILIDVLDAQIHIRNYIMTGDENYKNNYLMAKGDSYEGLNVLRKLVVGNQHQQKEFTLIEARVKAELEWLEQSINVERAGGVSAVRSKMVLRGEDLLNSLHVTFEQIEREHHQHIEQLKRDAGSVSLISYIIVFSGTLTSMLIFMVVIFRLNSAVTERLQQEKTLLESEEKFRKITESAQDAIIMMGADQCISFWNAAAERMFGYSAAEAIGQELHALIVPASAHAKFILAFPHFQETGEGALVGKITEVIALHKNGKELSVELSISATRWNDQWHAISIVRDITERKKSAVKIKEQLDYLERFQKVAVKREFRIKEMADVAEKLKAEIEGLRHG